MRKDVFAWALCAVPLVGVVELMLHVKQTTNDVVSDEDWTRARDVVKAQATREDLVLFAPFWADPVGRQFFGDELSDIRREARPDESRFKRTFEVSIRGAHRPELDGWKKIASVEAGKITITTFENPAPVRLLTDLVELAKPERVSVSRIDERGESQCPFQHGVGQPGGLGVPQGPAVPADKFVCPAGGYVGVAVLHDIDHHPHRCLFATAVGGASTLRIRFKNVAFGAAIHGHSGVQWLTARTPTDERITLSMTAFDHTLGRNPHKVGSGWTGFEFPTADLAGKNGELVAEISTTGNTRSYCFEADTREGAQ